MLPNKNGGGQTRSKTHLTALALWRFLGPIREKGGDESRYSRWIDIPSLPFVHGWFGFRCDYSTLFPYLDI